MEDEALPGSVRTRLANAMSTLFKEHYGRGPDGAKAWVLDDRYVLIVLEGGLTRSEETLIRAGREEAVRRYRLEYQDAISSAAMTAVEQIVGRRVATYHSQIVFGPVRCFEMFVLADE